MADQTHNSRDMTRPVRMVHFPFPLRSDVTVEIVAPPDMTADEAGRLAQYVRTIAVDWTSENSTRAVIRAAIEEWAQQWRHPFGTVSEHADEERDDLAGRIERALSPIRHEDTAAHWRANAAEECRKKQHVSSLLSEAIRERDEARDEVARLRRQPLDEHPGAWRLGSKLNDTDLGPVTLYDATLEGDGGRPGRWIGSMHTAALGRRVVYAVNGLAELEAEVRMLGEIVRGSGLGINGIPLQDFVGLPRIAALLQSASDA